MKRKISALLLTILLAMTIACDAFAWTHTLSGTGITPPARFSSVEETKDGLECKFKDARSREGLIYMPAGKLPETAFKKEISRLLKSFEHHQVLDLRYRFWRHHVVPVLFFVAGIIAETPPSPQPASFPAIGSRLPNWPLATLTTGNTSTLATFHTCQAPPRWRRSQSGSARKH